mgnify:CR=1 FL=1
MNRQDKIQKLHDKRLKRARAKLKTSSKERYVSKADRAKTESENSAVESNAEDYSPEATSS